MTAPTTVQMSLYASRPVLINATLMIKIYSNIIPFSGYKALTMWPLLFVRKGARFGEVDERHEKIHGKQQKEMLLVLFPLWYALEYLVRLCIYRSHRKAYKTISLEQEAYGYQEDIYYLSRRRHYAWVRYIFKNKDNN